MQQAGFSNDQNANYVTTCIFRQEKRDSEGKMNVIKINGHILDAALLVDDPEVKKTYTDASGRRRHLRSFSQPGRLKSYLRRHPEGLIIAGAGNLFFLEPVPVSASMIRFDETGSADILIREGAEQIEKQLAAMEAIQAAAAEEFGITRKSSSS